MLFSKGHRPPREGSEVALDNVAVGAVGMLEESPDVAAEELAGPAVPDDVEPERVGADLEGPVSVVGISGVGVDDPVKALEIELELPSVALEEIEAEDKLVLLAAEIVAVLLGDKEKLPLDEAISLETGPVVALAGEEDTITVVVILTEAVPETVPST